MIKHFCDVCSAELKAEPDAPSFTLPDKTVIQARIILPGKPAGHHPHVCPKCVNDLLGKAIALPAGGASAASPIPPDPKPSP